VALISEITELNIGHNIIARAVFVGLERAVTEMRHAIASPK
jgi:pyridoxine 5-phosphate synthase